MDATRIARVRGYNSAAGLTRQRRRLYGLALYAVWFPLGWAHWACI